MQQCTATPHARHSTAQLVSLQHCTCCALGVNIPATSLPKIKDAQVLSLPCKFTPTDQSSSITHASKDCFLNPSKAFFSLNTWRASTTSRLERVYHLIPCLNPELLRSQCPPTHHHHVRGKHSLSLHTSHKLHTSCKIYTAGPHQAWQHHADAPRGRRSKHVPRI